MTKKKKKSPNLIFLPFINYIGKNIALKNKIRLNFKNLENIYVCHNNNKINEHKNHREIIT
jgi:hypothetical protein